MRLEERKRLSQRAGQAESFLTDVIAICESEEESLLLDRLFGEHVGPDGLIGRGEFEVRLSDGYAEHYVLLHGRKLTTRGNG